jgi:hypothetical protein
MWAGLSTSCIPWLRGLWERIDHLHRRVSVFQETGPILKNRIRLRLTKLELVRSAPERNVLPQLRIDFPNLEGYRFGRTEGRNQCRTLVMALPGLWVEVEMRKWVPERNGTTGERIDCLAALVHVAGSGLLGLRWHPQSDPGRPRVKSVASSAAGELHCRGLVS